MDTDIVVVGSGHNGLVCAAYLAKWGYRVTVLERRDTIGGAVCTEEMFGGFRLDVGGSLHFMIHHTPIVADLELEKYGLEYIPLDPFMSAPAPDGSCIQFYQDLDKTCQSIARVSERDADAYRTFVKRWQPLNEAVFEFFLQKPTNANLGRTLLLRKFHDRSFPRTELVRSLFQSYGRFVNETFESEQLRSALVWWGAQSGPPPIDAMSAEFVGWHSIIHKRGPARPRGGSGMLTQALARYIEAHGGQVLANQEVSRILVENGRACGAETVAGERFTSRAVVAGAHLRVTYLQLLKDWTPPELRSRLAKVHVGNGFGMVLRCAMDALPQYQSRDSEGILNGLQLLCPSVQYLHDAYADYLKGLPSEYPAAIGMTFSAVDPTLAPAGKHTLFVWGQYYPYQLRGGSAWGEIQQREVEKLLGVVEQYAPGTREAVRDIYVQTPPVIADKHNMPNANVMHVEMLTDQMFQLRPLPELAGYEAPLPGLFMANAGMHPGGGIFGAAGYNCSRVVRKKIRRVRG